MNPALISSRRAKRGDGDVKAPGLRPFAPHPTRGLAGLRRGSASVAAWGRRAGRGSHRVTILKMTVAGLSRGRGRVGPRPRRRGRRRKLDSGVVEGGAASGELMVFKGIPYAASNRRRLPLGARRKPVAHWSGTRPRDQLRRRLPAARILARPHGPTSGRRARTVLFLNVLAGPPRRPRAATR